VLYSCKLVANSILRNSNAGSSESDQLLQLKPAKKLNFYYRNICICLVFSDANISGKKFDHVRNLTRFAEIQSFRCSPDHNFCGCSSQEKQGSVKSALGKNPTRAALCQKRTRTHHEGARGEARRGKKDRIYPLSRAPRCVLIAHRRHQAAHAAATPCLPKG
jgi:hypothetical protein